MALGWFRLGAVLVLNFEGVIRGHIRTQCDSTFLPDTRKDIFLFGGSPATASCSSDKIVLRCR